MSSKVPSVKPRDTRRNGPKYSKTGTPPMQAPRKWSPEEDELLRAAVSDIGAKHWKLVAERVPGRNHVQCLQRYLRVLQPGLKKGHWTVEEDEKLRSLASKGFTSWTEAAEQIPGRSAKQCRDRWRNHLEASIKHGPWEPEEDALLLQLHAKHGNRWAAIARCIPGRTENAVKIHCKSLLARKDEEASETFEIASGFESNEEQQQQQQQQQPQQLQQQRQQQQVPLPVSLPLSQNPSSSISLPTYDDGNTLIYQNKTPEDEEEGATDDFSSISPLPSPLNMPSQ